MSSIDDEMRRLALPALGVLLVTGSLACAHRSVEPPSTPQVAPLEAAVAPPGRQALLRVRYRGLDGRGRVRVTVRAQGIGEFQLAAADVFGRQLWTFGGHAGASLLLDHRTRQVCRFEGEVAVQAIALSDLPVSLLPRVLLGELPFAASSTGGLEIDHLDDAGRRWTAVVDADGRPRSWTLWQGEQAQVWWQATEGGAIMSHRDGAQVIWTVMTEEPLDVPLGPLEVPAGYAAGECGEQDLS